MSNDNKPAAAPGIDLRKVIAVLKEIADFDDASDCTTGEGHSDAIYKARELLAQIDAIRMGSDVQDDRFPNGLTDAIAYANDMENAAADLYQQVLGYETDGSDTGTDMLRTVLRELRASSKGGSDVREAIAPVIAELESAHVQNNKYRMGCLGADNIDTAVRLLTALQATSAEVGS
jgi:hypothetical protein